MPRQDRWRIPDALAFGSFAVAHPRLANGDRANAGHDLAFRKMAVAHDALMARLGLVTFAGQVGLDRDNRKVTFLEQLIKALGRGDDQRSLHPLDANGAYGQITPLFFIVSTRRKRLPQFSIARIG